MTRTVSSSRVRWVCAWVGVSLGVSLTLGFGFDSRSWTRSDDSIRHDAASTTVQSDAGVVQFFSALGPTVAEVREAPHGRVGPNWRARLLRGVELSTHSQVPDALAPATLRPRQEPIERRSLISRRRTCPRTSDGAPAVGALADSALAHGLGAC